MDACAATAASAAFLSYTIPAVVRDGAVGPLVAAAWRQQHTQSSPSVLATPIPGAGGETLAVICVLAFAPLSFSEKSAAALEDYARLAGLRLGDLLSLRTDAPGWARSSDRWLPGFRCVLDRDGTVREAPGVDTGALSPGASFVDSLSSTSRDRGLRLLYGAMGGASSEVSHLSWPATENAPVSPVRAHLLFSEGRPQGFFVTGWSRGEPRGRAQALASPAPAIWGVVDMDRFGVVNDMHGRAAGDRILHEIRSRLADAAGAGARVWRTGGDEFAVRAPLIAPQPVPEALASRLLDALRRPFPAGAATVSLSATAGFALSPLHGEDSAGLILLARSAMSRGKSRGKNQWTMFEPGWGPSEFERLELEAGLRAAVVRGQLRLAFQPVVSLRDGSVGHATGVEALVEWAHPRRGRIGAARFIPLAEDAGVIEEIGEWVFREATRFHSTWREAGLEPGRLAINVSPYQVSRPGFADRILALFVQTGMPPGELELEITESRPLAELDEACRRLARLRAAGISICLDDFGAGYSSLRLLHQLPLDAVKIDRSVIASLAAPGGTQDLVRAYLGLARQRKLRIVAEGVETARQYELLAAAGCDEAQGFLISPPLPAAELEFFLRNSGGRAGAAEA